MLKATNYNKINWIFIQQFLLGVSKLKEILAKCIGKHVEKCVVKLLENSFKIKMSQSGFQWSFCRSLLRLLLFLFIIITLRQIILMSMIPILQVCVYKHEFKIYNPNVYSYHRESQNQTVFHIEVFHEISPALVDLFKSHLIDKYL